MTISRQTLKFFAVCDESSEFVNVIVDVDVPVLVDVDGFEKPSLTE